MSEDASLPMGEMSAAQRLGDSPPGDPQGPVGADRLRAARQAALQAAGKLVAQPTSVVEFHSRGCVLVTGPAHTAAAAVSALGDNLRIVVLAQRGDANTNPAAPPPPGVDWQVGTIAAIEGSLGGFRVTAKADPAPMDLGPLSANRDGLFDLVLDLGTPATLRMDVPPLGYFAPGDDPARLEQALAEIPELVGEFEKPKFFALDPSLCAHSRRGLVACTRCLDACPADAIHSVDNKIEVDPRLCQGGGTCATACPSGAIRYAYPGPGDSLARLRAMLGAFRAAIGDAGTEAPRILFHDSGPGAAMLEGLDQTLPLEVLPMPMEELAAAGMELWLGAIAYGAQQVVLLSPPQTPPSSLAELRRQLDVAQALLSGLGHAVERIELIEAKESADLSRALASLPPYPPLPAATFAAMSDKRTALFLALDHLHASAARTRPMIDLPTGAPFGSVGVDQDRCTLCLACVAVCPGKALQDDPNTPRLSFLEGNCLQCGMCTRACPEDAIWIAPRFLFDPEARRRSRVLREEEPFCCVSCGKPFSTQSAVDRLSSMLRDHPMFAGAGLARLRMCEDCRVRDMMVSGDGDQWFPARPEV